jgi:hypothetical protein
MIDTANYSIVRTIKVANPRQHALAVSILLSLEKGVPNEIAERGGNTFDVVADDGRAVRIEAA